MKLAVTIDVEEEGLFRGRYDQRETSIENIARLVSLDPIFREWGVRPTLLLTYPVARNARCGDLLNELRERWNGEIGAHLHHWNTPPFVDLPHIDPVPSDLLPKELLASKLENLLSSIRFIGASPTSFRMGRFNMGPRMFAVLQNAGVLVDSSVAPMRHYYGGPGHLAARTDPYFPDPGNPLNEGNSMVLEVPITILPVFQGVEVLVEKWRRWGPISEKWASHFAMYLGSLAAQPMWTGFRRLQAAVRMHASRGGEVLTVFFHSSELMPGGCPQHTSAQDVDRFLAKLERFIAWLRREMQVESLTLSELGELYRRRQALEPAH